MIGLASTPGSEEGAKVETLDSVTVTDVVIDENLVTNEAAVTPEDF